MRGSSDVLRVFSPYGRAGASARVRVFQWLERTGLEHALSEYLGTSRLPATTFGAHPLAAVRAERALRAVGRRPGAVLVHRCATPLSRGDVEADLLRHGSPGVYDFDDALQWQRPGTGLMAPWFPRPLAAVASVKAAARVIAGNATLAEWAAGHNRDVRLIPSCVEPGYYVRKRTYELGDPPVLGWVGSPSTERYLDAIAPALLDVHRRTGAWLLVVNGPERRPGPLDAITRRVTWNEDYVHNHMAEWDVGIMPLANSLYERGKCGYKLLEYGAAGLPVVASPVGVNGELVAAMSGLAASSLGDWADALVAMIESTPDCRRAMGDRGRSVVETSYSYTSWEAAWRDAVGA